LIAQSLRILADPLLSLVISLWFEPPAGERGTGAERDKFADR
jgi:hypothetical protein